VTKTLSQDERIELNKIFPRFKKQFIDTYGVNNKAVSEDDIVEFAREILSTPAVPTSATATPISATATATAVSAKAARSARDRIKEFGASNGIRFKSGDKLIEIIRKIEEGGLEVPSILADDMRPSDVKACHDDGLLSYYSTALSKPPPPTLKKAGAGGPTGGAEETKGEEETKGQDIVTKEYLDDTYKKDNINPFIQNTEIVEGNKIKLNNKISSLIVSYINIMLLHKNSINKNQKQISKFCFPAKCYSKFTKFVKLEQKVISFHNDFLISNSNTSYANKLTACLLSIDSIHTKHTFDSIVNRSFKYCSVFPRSWSSKKNDKNLKQHTTVILSFL
jgi:hypothetical protein